MSSLPIDALILGGGATGLWLRALLKEYGRSVVLIESRGLGSGQTIASQGILHSGAKYAARADSAGMVSALQGVTAAWERHLAGDGIPDLRDVKIVTSETWFWNPERPLPSSLESWRGDERGGEPGELPGVLTGCGSVHCNRSERSLCAASLLNVLAGDDRSDLLQVPEDHICWEVCLPGTVSSVTLRHPRRDESLVLRPDQVFLAAGAGNAALREAVGLSAHHVAQQRPLRMALLRGPLPRLCGHWFDDEGPRLTVSTQLDQTGQTIWQLGGRAAEDPGRHRPRAFLEFARKELQAGLPAMDLSEVPWASYEAIRSEPKSADGGLPDDAVILSEGNVTTLWPTKLTLLPTLMARVRRRLDAAGEHPRSGPVKLPDWPQPLVAQPPWESRIDWIADAELSATG